jgi:hypothetical protein
MQSARRVRNDHANYLDNLFPMCSYKLLSCGDIGKADSLLISRKKQAEQGAGTVSLQRLAEGWPHE